jgi:hypothetical protein
MEEVSWVYERDGLKVANRSNGSIAERRIFLGG